MSNIVVVTLLEWQLFVHGNLLEWSVQETLMS